MQVSVMLNRKSLVLSLNGLAQYVHAGGDM